MSGARKLADELAASFAGRRVEPERVDSWAEQLGALTQAQAVDVVDLLRLRCTDPPSVAQVIQCAAEVFRECASESLPFQGGTRPAGPLPAEMIHHGFYHLRGYLGSGDSPSGRDGRLLQLALRPWECSCGASAAEPSRGQRAPTDR